LRVPTAAALCNGPPPFLRHEVFQRDDQECSQPAFFGIREIEPVLLEEAAEELLSKILRILRCLATAADVSVKGIPVGAAEGL